MTARSPPQPPFIAYRGSEPFVFVSYAHEDAADVYGELTWLHGAGVNIWYDEGIRPGHVWPRELASTLDRCSVVLIFMSRNTICSMNCLRETHFAIEHGKHLLVVHLDDVELPPDWEFVMGTVRRC